MAAIYENIADLDFSLDQLEEAAFPSHILMCPPDYFDVIDVKNPFMVGGLKSVDRQRAEAQWVSLRQVFLSIGLKVDAVEALTQCEDMVFAANQTLVGFDCEGKLCAVAARMRYPSRQQEVAAFTNWFVERGIPAVKMPDEVSAFEAGGDGIWHPQRKLLWGGIGPRTARDAWEVVAEVFETPVVVLRLVTERYYHLDTCFCPVTKDTAIAIKEALDAPSRNLLAKLFETVFWVPEDEAENMVCNSAAFFGKCVVMPKGNPVTEAFLRRQGLEVIPVDVSEFHKSGGSVFCLKTAY